MKGLVQSPTDSAWPDELSRILLAGRAGIVIWDFDGVISNTEPVHAESYRKLLQMRGHEPEHNFFSPLIGNTERRIWRMLRETGAHIPESDDELIAERREIFLQMALSMLGPSWITEELVTRFADMGVRQVICSNGDAKTIETLLKAWGLSTYLEQPLSLNITNSQTTSKNIFEKKELLISLLSSGPSVTLEDNQTYLKLAHQAGSFCVAVRHNMSPDWEIHGDVNVAI